MENYMNYVHPNLDEKAMFRSACRHGQVRSFWCRLTGKKNELCSLGDEMQKMVIDNSAYKGFDAVRIRDICGSENKKSEFDSEFNPIQERTKFRWLSIARCKLDGRELPPVELIKVGNIYYVRDGHHRISVSRRMGQSYIDAEVTVVKMHRQES